MKKLFGLVAIGGLMMLAMPAPQAHAASLINPAISAPISAAAAGPGITEVRWGHRHHWRRWHRHHHWRRWHHRRWR
jgi:hypothetical protein